MYSMLYATVKSEKEAVSIAKLLLCRRLVACANIFPIRSLYRWRGKVNDVTEFAMIMKTQAELVGRAIKEAAAVHPYEIPCLVSYPMGEGLPEFLNWIDEETGRGLSP